MIELKGNTVLRDGEEVGVVDEKNVFHPVQGLHHKTVTMVEKELSKNQGGQAASRLPHKQEIAGSSPAPGTTSLKGEPERTELGDIDPDLIEWRRENWTEADFVALYPASRLRQLGL